MQIAPVSERIALSLRANPGRPSPWTLSARPILQGGCGCDLHRRLFVPMGEPASQRRQPGARQAELMAKWGSQASDLAEIGQPIAACRGK
jgi:hypothetical protein